MAGIATLKVNVARFDNAVNLSYTNTATPIIRY